MSGAETANLSAVVGSWFGALHVKGRELKIVVHVDAKGTGSLDSPAQNAYGIPVRDVAVEHGAFGFAAPTIAGEYRGQVDADTQTITGEWRQRGTSLPLSLRREAGEGHVQSRPQDPSAPLPYVEEEVAFASLVPNIRLAGTVTKPEGAGPFPAVVLLSGSGSQDRDCAIYGHRPFRVIADHLTRRGFAVLRFDDRGVGGSSGEFKSLHVADSVADAIGATKYLLSRSDIDKRRVGIIGHSEGGLMACLAALDEPGISFLVLLATAAVPIEEILIEQVSAIAKIGGASEEQIAKEVDLQRKAIKAVQAALSPAAAVEAARATLMDAGLAEERADASAKVFAVPLLYELISYDPRRDIGRLRVPILALYGELDVQVGAETNARQIEALLAHRTGQEEAVVKKLSGLNHLFQPATTGGPYEYAGIETTFDEEALRVIAEWLEKR
jgi:hypothetical protein